ncbi:hypothetical protein M0R45_036116 [Rubus argutus]|uniref:Uncharacterized protein n=1 Tax=Rubus argutus TaxID=59490 RepID=A0AAW1VWW6_RUBAR
MKTKNQALAYSNGGGFVNQRGEHNGASSLLDLLPSDLRDQLGLHNQQLRSRQLSLAQDLEVAELSHVEQRSLAGSICGLVLHFSGHHGPWLLE